MPLLESILRAKKYCLLGKHVFPFDYVTWVNSPHRFHTRDEDTEAHGDFNKSQIKFD